MRELLPAPSRLRFGDLRFVGSRFSHDSLGNQVGTESIYSSKGEQSITFFPTDSTGVDIAKPASYSGFTVEGEDGIEGLTYRTVERDEFYRPKKAIAFKTSNGVAGGLVDTINTRVAGEHKDFVPGGYEELTFTYDPRSGLLSTITETREYEGTVTKSVHENIFNAEGKRIGYIQKELVDIDSSSGQEEYDITEMRIYEQGTNRWREVVYTGFRDGLVPWQVNEGSNDKLFSLEDISYLRPRVSPELWKYQIAAEPDKTTLVEQKAMEKGSHTIALPAWIPKTAAYDIAQKAVSLDDAGENPYIAELGVPIITPEEAFQKVLSYQSTEQITDFINGLRSRREVILHSDLSFPLLKEIVFRSQTDLYEPMTLLQKIGTIAALHPVFVREDIVPDSILGASNDQQVFTILLRSLAIGKESVRDALFPLNTLSSTALQCFSYLLQESEK